MKTLARTKSANRSVAVLSAGRVRLSWGPAVQFRAPRHYGIPGVCASAP